ncbi:peptidoglycan DL-endopeptidase CwlO [Bacillus mycoides]|nr:peptidoglycan DL-endopeptidase CwlO [Bacillus mycoides]KUH42801.1 hypothetical protein M2E15_1033 [Bacillus mycoides]KUH43815.1 hypothetical protein M2E15_6048 [Bacillus mycoides]
MNVSPEVLKWEPTIRKHVKAFGVESFVALMLAQMMQERFLIVQVLYVGHSNK